jgi:hypothetical protein
MVSPEEFARVKRKRLTAARNNAKENTYVRRRSKKIIAEKNLERLLRSYENDVGNLRNP